MTNKMDYQFPKQLFPSFYNCGPPDSVQKQHCAGNWGSYDRVRLQGSSGPLSSRTFTSRHQVSGETWRHIEPVPVPLLSPKNSYQWSSVPPDPQNFPEHMQNFFVDHCQDAFGCMSEILGGNFILEKKKSSAKDAVDMRRVKKPLDTLKMKKCQKAFYSKIMDRYSILMYDVVHAVPPELLGSLLYEELTVQRDRLLFAEGATGGALAFVPYLHSGSSSGRGCLLYPGHQGLDCLNFHRVELQHQRGSSSCVDATSSGPFSFQLRGPIRQISSASLFNDCCVAVRSDHLCGVWRFSETNEPRLLQVVSTNEVATCISVSPHVLGEVLVASESGAAKLWTVGRGMQKVREEDSNLYFNAKSSWRWCEFSAHPRVMLYADRTGVELTDIRENPASGHTLFRISNTSECHSGERLILSKYLGDINSFHHLITTQYSAYIMDERFPSIPMLKWDHVMQSPPMFCHVISASTSCGSVVDGARTHKVLLGSQNSQEITLLQYSGGSAEACSSRAPLQSLLRPRDSLRHLPVQIPHRLDTATNRLSSSAAGLTCIQQGGREAGGEECICVLQLTEAGDIFYQILELQQPDASPAPAAEEGPLPQQAAKKTPQPTLKEAATSQRKTTKQLQPDSQLLVSDTSSDEGIIEPTQWQTVQRNVAETPERDQGGPYSESSEEDSESAGKGRNLKHLVQVVVNDQSELDQVSELDTAVKGGRVDKNNADDTGEPGSVGEKISSLSPTTPIKLSDSTLVTWKRWLQKLRRKSREKEPHPPRLQHFTVDTKGLLHLSDKKVSGSTEEECVQSLRSHLRACMSKRKLLVHRDLSDSLEVPLMIPLSDPVDTESWTDPLSQRLTLSWQSEEAWRAWWDDKLGLNREEKVEALRRKRRREKNARRASGRRLELSGSFTSSQSYQSELDDFSDLSGWTSATSQEACSDAESILSQFTSHAPKSPRRAATPSSVQADTPVPMPTATPQSVQDKRADQQTPSCSRVLSLSQTPKSLCTPTSQRRNKHPAKDYLSSLFAPQDEPLQHDSYFLEEGSSVRPSAQPVASFSQLHSSQPASQRSLRVDLSQNDSVRSGFSQSLSQSSQGRLGLSQASQPKKKKSKMGF